MNSLPPSPLVSLAAGAAGAALLPLMSRLTSAGPPKVARFLFVVEGNCYEPITVLDPSTKAAINATTKGPIDGDRWWPQFYQHQSPIDTVPSTQFAQTVALPAIASLGLCEPDRRRVRAVLSDHGVGNSATTTASSAPLAPRVDCPAARRLTPTSRRCRPCG